MHYKTSRRTFVKGLTAAGIVGGLGLWRTPVWALTSPGQPNVLAGSQFDLVIGETPVNITGKTRLAKTINGSM
ncbi:MAG: twin-arginine translocation signal domain-containing protein, partial [Halopseudomonas sabulinigri]